jgi:glycosyltransferase involved in cell wall biosynthesis
MIAKTHQHYCPADNVLGAPRKALPRVLYAIALDGTQKLGSLEEQILLLGQAFRAEDSVLLPLFLNPAVPERERAGAFKSAGLATAHLDLWKFRWKTLWQLNRLVSQHQIQLIHWHFYPPINPYFLALAAMRPGIRHYFTDHNSRCLPIRPTSGGIGRVLKRMLLKRYQKVLCVSQFVGECLDEQRSWSDVQCCLHFINTERFRPDAVVRQAMRREQGCEDRFVVLAVAHLIREKGIDVALRALAETEPSTVMWVVGGGCEATALKELALALGIQDRVKFFGQQAQVQPFMQAADCFVCPSLWAEAAGLVNVEAQSTGIPVVASRLGGIPEYVEDGRTGLLFPPGDHHALAALLRRLHDTPDECQRFGETARLTAIRRFSVASRIDEHLDVYRMFS